MNGPVPSRGRSGPARPCSDALFRDALDRRRLTVLFQPLVDLRGGTVVGHEALSRGPAGTRLEQPAGLFAAARAAGRTAELDWACRCTAFSDALAGSRCPSWRLFVNAEPDTLGSPCPADLVPQWRRAHRALRVVVELTERALLRRPAQLLQVVSTLRELGWEIALDDVGANHDGVALLPVVEPDVVKLDAALLGERLDGGQRATLRAVQVWAARSGGVVVAEGIETERQRDRAVDLGAAWGQGFLFGRPSPFSPLPPDAAAPARRPRWTLRRPREEPFGATPFRLASQRSRPADRAEVDRALQQVHALAGRAPESALLLVAVGEAPGLPQSDPEALRRLGERCALVALYAGRLAADPGQRVRTTRLRPDDALVEEVAALLLGPADALLVAARGRPDGGLDLVRTADRGLVAQAARALLRRTAPLPTLEAGNGADPWPGAAGADAVLATDGPQAPPPA